MRLTKFVILLLGPLLICRAGFAQTNAPGSSAPLHYNRDIRPILSENCFSCHGPDSAARKAKLRLDNFEDAIAAREQSSPAFVPGKPDQSEAIRRIYDDGDDIMPPLKSHRTMTGEQKAVIKEWVAQGAKYEPHWSYLSIQHPSPPRSTASKWGANEIDAFVLQTLERENLKPSPPASPETLIRRLALNLTGLPPDFEDVEEFSTHPTDKAYGELVEKYLASPAYGERMALDWLDLARYADTYGYQEDASRDMSAWRDWVIRSFKQNLPYCDFLTWQIAGDLLPDATDEERLATAFNRLHRQTNEGGSIDEEFRNEYTCDRVNTFGTAMLGLTLGCAKCHDHKYDPITQKDYYSMEAFFNNIDESGLYSHFTHATPSPSLLLWNDAKRKQDEAALAKVKAAETNLSNIVHSARPNFEQWLKSAKLEMAKPINHFTFDSISNGISPDLASTNHAKMEDGVKLVEGRFGKALHFSGDDEVTCANTGNFHRWDEFSISLWIKPSEVQDRAVVLHHSRAWSDSGSRGYELVLDHGKPFFGLIHFWPGNAIAIESSSPLPTNEWTHVVLTYDGSSRASGLCIYLNGHAAETKIVRDHLFKDIVHRQEWDDMEAKKPLPLVLAARFRDSGFKNGEIGDLQIFNQALTPLEAGELFAPGSISKAGREQTFAYYLSRVDTNYIHAAGELKSARREEYQIADDVPEIMVMEEMPVRRVTHLLKRGAYDAPGDEVFPDVPSKVMPLPADYPRNRLGLAKWLVDPKNPLAARVAVNRIWKQHFGRGIVATPEDFGVQGRTPSHPELLDWLASWFVDHHWDVKALHRLIVNSETFKQNSTASPELLERDPDNQLLARGPKFRLMAEQVRDSALADSGLLNQAIGGPSVFPYQPAGLWEQSGTGKTYTQDHGDKLYRRSLYTFWRRTAPPPSMLTFDAVSREVCTARRENTATPLQSLVLLNDPQFIEASRVLGEKLVREFPSDPDKRAQKAFRILVGRSPDDAETKILNQLFAEQMQIFSSDEAGATNLLSVGEHKPDTTLPKADFAATTLMVNAIINYDEFIVER